MSSELPRHDGEPDEAPSWGADLEGPLVLSVAGPARSHRELLHGSVWLVANVGLAALGSFAFWLVAANIEPAPVVGVAAALFTAMMFLNYATALGLPIAIARYAAGSGRDAHTLFAWSLIATVLSSVIGVLFLMVIALSTLRPMLHAFGTPGGLLIFTVLVIGVSVSVLVDVRLVTLHRWGWVLVKGAAGVLLRFPLLLFRPTGYPGVALFLCAAAPPAVLGIISSFIVLGRTGWSSLRAPLPTSTRAAVRFASVNYLGQLAVQGPTLILPLIAVENVSKTEYASFYVAFSVATVVFLIPLTIGQVLLTEGGLRGADLGAQTRLALRLAFGAVVLATVASVPGSRLVTAAYGPSYQKAADLLTPLVAAALAWCVTTMYLTEARVEEDTPGTVAISVSFFVATLLPALVLASMFGLTGVTVSWIVGNAVAMVTAIVVHRRAPRYPVISWRVGYPAHPS